MSRRKSATKEKYSSNCIQERNLTQRSKDFANLKKGKDQEKDMIKKGYKQTLENHPPTFRAKVIKWVKA